MSVFVLNNIIIVLVLALVRQLRDLRLGFGLKKESLEITAWKTISQRYLVCEDDEKTLEKMEITAALLLEAAYTYISKQ